MSFQLFKTPEYNFQEGNPDDNFEPLTEDEEKKFVWRVHWGEGSNSDRMTAKSAMKVAKLFNAPFIWKAAGIATGFVWPNFEYRNLKDTC